MGYFIAIWWVLQWGLHREEWLSWATWGSKGVGVGVGARMQVQVWSIKPPRISVVYPLRYHGSYHVSAWCTRSVTMGVAM